MADCGTFTRYNQGCRCAPCSRARGEAKRTSAAGNIRPTDIRPNDTWRDQAACAGHPTRWWFPDSEPSAKVRAICEACPVREPCAAYALEYEQWGFWGGLTEADRRAHRRRKSTKASRVHADDVAAIRAQVAGGVTYRAVAERFGVSTFVVGKIVRHVAPYDDAAVA